MHRFRKPLAWALLASIVALFVAGIGTSSSYQQCGREQSQHYREQTDKEGAPNFFVSKIIRIQKVFRCTGAFLQENDAALTALFTIVLAISTSLLWWSTRNLWHAARNQSGEMQKSIAEAARAATAMEEVARQFAISAKAAQDSVATVKERTAMQMRAYLTVIFNGGVYQEIRNGVQLKFEVKPLLVNTGQTPARKVSYWAKADIFPHPLPDELDLVPGVDNLHGAFVLGPHQNIVLNAIVDTVYGDEEAEAIKRGRGFNTYIWGEVTYEDVFEVTHTTEFCHSIYWALGPSGEIPFGTYAPRHSEAT